VPTDPRLKDGWGEISLLTYRGRPYLLVSCVGLGVTCIAACRPIASFLWGAGRVVGQGRGNSRLRSTHLFWDSGRRGLLVISRASATWLFRLVPRRVARSSLPKALLLPNLLSPGGTGPSAPGERCAPLAKLVASLVGCAHLRPANFRPFLGHKSGKLSLSPTVLVSVSSRSLSESENYWGFRAVGSHSGPSGWPVVDLSVVLPKPS
jgi:hypothetical protein